MAGKIVIPGYEDPLVSGEDQAILQTQAAISKMVSSLNQLLVDQRDIVSSVNMLWDAFNPFRESSEAYTKGLEARIIQLEEKLQELTQKLEIST